MTIRREPPRARLVQDACRVIYLGAMVLGVAAVVLYLPPAHPPWLDAIGRILAALTVHLLVIAVLREVVPRARVGSHRVGQGSDYLRWLVSVALRDVANHVLVRWPFSFLHVTRYLYLRAQGARIEFGASFVEDLVVRDPSLVSIESGAQLEAGVVIENGVYGTGRVRIDSVLVSKGALVGPYVQLMPGAVIGPDARIGASTYVGPDVQIGVGARIGERAVLATGVDIGSYVRVGAGAVLADGVSVGDRARILAGAVIPPRTRIRPGEVWQGVPARPVFRDAGESGREMSQA